MIREALLYEKIAVGRTQCRLCGHQCIINQGKRGLCGVRENREGVLHTLVYGKIIAENVDPIEKKPLFHVHPGSRSFSIATVGCNFCCDFCQNYNISQMPRESGDIAGREMTPADIVERAISSGSRTIAYTYTEPTVYFEFAFDTARLAHERGLKNVFVTNGYMTGETIEMIAPYLDAANVDLKSYREEFYRDYCGARLMPVLDSLKKMKELGVWIEVTTLVIPALNDGIEELKGIAGFVYSLGAETPWHVSRFHPQYKMTSTPPTAAGILLRALQIGRDAGLKYVYVGNIPGGEGENTYCYNCGKLLIGRYGFSIKSMALEGNACPDCGTVLEGIY
ncbi:MAG: AmmeMemoRadiSam system radical SAM enzyme [Syntrophales bacterium]|nr:AmmeMemoRadiSam system radical SAM enzyme [Syntrophales bacterium]